MKKVLDVKTWKDSKRPQFRIPFVGVIKISHRAIRINDNMLFSSDDSALSRIFFEKRIGNISFINSSRIRINVRGYCIIILFK